MAEKPATWHYGLVARWWAEFNKGGPEVAYFQTFVEDGQPALDVACGTGRLLLPYLRAGLDVDGCDISGDMVALCREQAELDQRVTFELRAAMWRDGELVAEEEHRLTERMYFKDELVLMLEQAGFVDAVVRGGNTDEEAVGDHDFLVFNTRKPPGL